MSSNSSARISARASRSSSRNRSHIGSFQLRRRIDIKVILKNINVDPSADVNYSEKNIQVKLWFAPPPPAGEKSKFVFGGKTEMKSIRSKRSKVHLSFSHRLSIPEEQEAEKLRFIFHADEKIIGATQLDMKKLEEAMTGNGYVAKKLRYKTKTLSDKYPFLKLIPEKVTASGPPKIERSEITLAKKIAQGAFGEVWVGSCRGNKVAVKKLKKETLESEAFKIEEFMDEITLMSENPNPNLVLLMGICHDENAGELFCVTELMAGDLGSLLLTNKNQRQFSLAQRVRMALDAAKGIAWLHTRDPPVLHRDIKPSNLLFDSSMTRIKVCDFGLSREVKADDGTLKEASSGSPIYMAPEALKSQPITVKSDVYSFAITCWEMFTQQEVFTEYTSGPDTPEAVQQRKRAWIEEVVFGTKRPALPKWWPASLKELLNDMWDADPKNRPEFKDDQIIKRLRTVQKDVEVIELKKKRKKEIKDPLAARFWVNYFLRDSEVWLSQLMEQFYKLIDVKLPDDPWRPALPENCTDAEILTAHPDQIEQLKRNYPLEEARVTEILSKKRPESSSNSTSSSPSSSSSSSAQPNTAAMIAMSGDSGNIELTNDNQRTYACMALLLCQNDPARNRRVSSVTFGKFVAWFGPLSDTDKFLARFTELAKQPYFFGKIDKSASAAYLYADSRHKSFLVRTSNSYEGCFTLSMIDRSNNISNMVIWRTGTRAAPCTGRRFVLQAEAKYSEDPNNTFESVPALIAMMQGAKKILEPCLASPWQAYWKQRQITNAYIEVPGVPPGDSDRFQNYTQIDETNGSDSDDNIFS